MCTLHETFQAETETRPETHSSETETTETLQLPRAETLAEMYGERWAPQIGYGSMSQMVFLRYVLETMRVDLSPRLGGDS